MLSVSRLSCALALVLVSAPAVLADAASVAAECIARIQTQAESGRTVIDGIADNGVSRIESLDAEDARPRLMIGASRGAHRAIGNAAARTRGVILRETRRCLGMLSREDADEATVQSVVDAAQAELESVGDSAQAARQEVTDALQTALADEQRPEIPAE